MSSTRRLWVRWFELARLRGRELRSARRRAVNLCAKSVIKWKMWTFKLLIESEIVENKWVVKSFTRNSRLLPTYSQFGDQWKTLAVSIEIGREFQSFSIHRCAIFATWHVVNNLCETVKTLSISKVFNHRSAMVQDVGGLGWSLVLVQMVRNEWGACLLCALRNARIASDKCRCREETPWQTS